MTTAAQPTECHAWTDDSVAIMNAAMARTGLVEDDVAAAWSVAASYWGADHADHEMTEASRERVLTLAEDYVPA